MKSYAVAGLRGREVGGGREETGVNMTSRQIIIGLSREPLSHMHRYPLNIFRMYLGGLHVRTQTSPPPVSSASSWSDDAALMSRNTNMQG